jgi:endonuclease YncB( thermonuclease family)
MKILSLLVSLLLGAAVLLVFSLGSHSRRCGGAPTHTRRTCNPFASAESTAAVDTATPKPAEVTPKPATPPASTTPDAANPTGPKMDLLANEEAEAKRSAALDDQMPATAPRETKRYFKARRDAKTLEAGSLPTNSVVIRLEGIHVREADETCKKESGATWPCGAEARVALTGFIRYRAVTCTLPTGGETKDLSGAAA